jgi:hypothetical protein
MGRSPLNDRERQVSSALKNAVLQSTVGVTDAEKVMLGTGTLLNFGAFKGILTARHVIENSNLQNLRFMAPRARPWRWRGNPKVRGRHKCGRSA